MEVSLFGSSRSQVNSGITKADLNIRNLGFFNFGNDKVLSWRNRVCFSRNLRNSNDRAFGFALKAARAADFVPAEKVSSASLESMDGVRLFVGLPLDAISECGRLNHEKAITVGLKALKLMGVYGVELPVWWGLVEKDAMGKYNWSGYLAVAELVRKMGLKLHVSLCFHGSRKPNIRLPEWVSRVGQDDPDVFFKDRSGRKYEDCLSLAVDELPIFDGKSPLRVYGDFCESFKSSFAGFMGTTITGITISLGPDGELRYPSSQKSDRNSGAGEFQCYDKYMLNHLKQHAAEAGKPLWGLSGPHDVPTYNQPPSTSTFFKDEDGSWETPYGDFFLSWYSTRLISHGRQVLSLASSIFSDNKVTVSGKLPLVYSWYKTRSHPSELTAGFYNTANRNGYEPVAKIFAENSCRMIIPGMNLLDEHDESSKSSPQSLLAQIKGTSRKHGVRVSGENLSVSRVSAGFEEIKKNLNEENGLIDVFMYQRMGAEFFSPKHFPLFSVFIRSLNQLDLDLDDMLIMPRSKESLNTSSEAQATLQTQEA